MNTKSCLLGLAIAMLFTTATDGQVVPTTPKKFAMRGVGSSATNTTTGITQTKTEPIIRTTTYIVLAPSRQWTNSDGKPLVAKLIAFEDVTTETTKSAAAANPTPPPSIPGKPTVVSDGKVRLLADKKPYEVPLAKLSQADQDFVSTLKQAVEGRK